MNRLPELTPYFEKSVTFTPPDTAIRRENATTLYNTGAFTSPGGPVQVGYTNWVSDWATWLEEGLKAVGMNLTTGFSNGDLLGYHYSQATIRSSDQTRSASDQYIYSANSSNAGDNLKVYTQTFAKKILFDGQKATGACGQR